MTRSSDPQLLADDLCELLHNQDSTASERELAVLLHEGKPAVDDALRQVSQRGLLGRLCSEKQLSADGVLLQALVDSVQSPQGRFLLCNELCQRADLSAQESIERIILSTPSDLPELFDLLIRSGNYERLIDLLTKNNRGDSPALRALAGARPSYGMAQLNQATTHRLLSEKESEAFFPYDLLIVPGYTPLDVDRPTHLQELPAALSRLDLAAADIKVGIAPCVLVSGGSVHPPGTPYNEALMMREQLLRLGVRSDQILVDPYARHSTTNLRNAGRVMRSLGMTRGLVVTGFDRSAFSQAFYFGHPVLSTFALRCQTELGYSIGRLDRVDDYHIAFYPSADVMAPSYDDPLDV